MDKALIKQLEKTARQEKQFLAQKQSKLMKETVAPAVAALEGKIPQKLRETLDGAFYKGFVLVFQKGTKYIERLFNKEDIQLEHDMRNYAIDRRVNRKTLRNMDNHSKKTRLINQSLTTLEGAGMGVLGVGLPDIPLFISVILKTVYEIALSYGFSYESEAEQVYILRLICAAVSKEQQREAFHQQAEELAHSLDTTGLAQPDLDGAMRETAKVLSGAMLAAKFLQGAPIVGAAGGIANFTILRRVGKYAALEYKKRYLSGKLSCVGNQTE